MCRGVFVVIVLTTFLGTLVYGAVFSECDKEPQNSFVAVANNCSKAIYCNGEDSTIVDCDNNKPHFSPADGMCYNNFSICGNRPYSLEYTMITTSIPTIATTIATTTSSGIKLTAKPTTTMTSVKTSPATISSDLSITNATSYAQTAPTPITTPHTTTTATTLSTTTTETSFLSNTSPPTKTSSTSKNTLATNHPTIMLECPSVDDPSKPLFLPHLKSCSKYYLCYHGFATLMECPNMLHFDVTQQTCNTASRAKCRVNSIIPRELCLAHTVEVYPHPTNCNYYYLCEYGFLMVMQCPFNMEWDYERRICTMKSKANCYNAFLIN